MDQEYNCKTETRFRIGFEVHIMLSYSGNKQVINMEAIIVNSLYVYDIVILL